MLTNEQKEKVKTLVVCSLEKAEKHWIGGASQLVENNRYSMEALASSIALDSEPSHIPGHSLVLDDVTTIDEFIAFVADMRDSSKHLMNAISHKIAKVSQLQRIYYETSALLPALALTIDFEGGGVTEYLGDGVLALFRVDSDDKSESIYAAHRAAKNAIGDTRDIVNEILMDRYNLPEIDLGVGLAMSKALVTLVGLDYKKHPKAFGECVFKATKLSGGKNQIFVDARLRNAWPTSKGGSLKFIEKPLKGVDGFLIGRS